MELCSVIQFVVELQHLLWLYRQILDIQALLQLSVVKIAPGSESRNLPFAVCAISSLPLLFSHHLTPLNA